MPIVMIQQLRLTKGLSAGANEDTANDAGEEDNAKILLIFFNLHNMVGFW